MFRVEIVFGMPWPMTEAIETLACVSSYLVLPPLTMTTITSYITLLKYVNNPKG